ncbi:hypothetical protein ACHQM5_027296 [Ranunculus cassubicifolius]
MENLQITTHSQCVNLSELPDHILSIIAKFLTNIVDFIKFGAVCHSWHLVYTQTLPEYHPPPQFPLLMISTDLDHYDETRSFCSLSKSSLSNYRVTMSHDYVCRGSSYGWLVIVDKVSNGVHLFNPFLGGNCVIRVPSVTEFKGFPAHAISNEYCLVNAVLSANPLLDGDYVVMAIYGGFNRLAYYKPGDKSWTCLDDDHVFYSVVYFHDQFYGVDRIGALYAIDLSDNDPKLSMVVEAMYEYTTNQLYLVESCGNLVMVKREVKYDSPIYFTTGFEVFKLDFVESKWVQVKDMCGQVLFLGDNLSMSLPASNCPWCDPNSIYFTDDNFYWHEFASPYRIYDTGVFNMEDGSIDRHYAMKSEMKFPPPIWVEPTPRRRFN